MISSTQRGNTFSFRLIAPYKGCSNVFVQNIYRISSTLYSHFDTSNSLCHRHGELAWHPHAIIFRISGGMNSTLAGNIVGSRVFSCSFLWYPSFVSSMFGGSAQRAYFQIAHCRWARLTLSSNTSVVGGNDANFGADVSFPAFFFVHARYLIG